MEWIVCPKHGWMVIKDYIIVSVEIKIMYCSNKRPRVLIGKT